MSVVVNCIRGNGVKRADAIFEPLLVTENMATTRGKRFLDDPSQGAYYKTTKRTFKVPHRVDGGGSTGHIEPGCWVTVTDGKTGLQNKNLKVIEYTINIDQSGVWANMVTEEYNEPE